MSRMEKPSVFLGKGGEMFERYARQIIMPEIGKTGQEKLLSSHVLVAGVGGLGSFSSFYLAAIGIGRLTLIDNGSTVASEHAGPAEGGDGGEKAS
jgi:tRNA A37 threonylcarbamoyladenosine dehydratase